MRCPRILCALALVAILHPAAAAAEIYRWVDEAGVPHFSDRAEDVPPAYRGQALQGAGESGEGRPTFVVVPGINGPTPAEGQRVAAPDDAAFETEALAALEQMARDGGRPRLQDLWQQIPREMIWKMAAGFAVALLVVCAFSAILLMAACRICGEEPLAFPKAIAITGLHLLATTAIGVLLLLYAPTTAAGMGGQGAQLGISTAVYAGLLRGLHSDSLGKALAVAVVAFLVTLAVTIGLVVLALCAGAGAAFSMRP